MRLTATVAVLIAVCPLVPQTILIAKAHPAIHEINSVSFEFDDTLGGPYLGLRSPSDSAQVFAPGIISTEMNEHSHPVFSKDFSEIFWSVYPVGVNDNQQMMRMVEIDGRWQEPEVVEFSRAYSEGNPYYSPDENRLYFQSERALKKDQEERDWNIWYIEKMDGVWSTAPKPHTFYPNTCENLDIFV